ncbi:MAG: hypothetical protein HEP71_18445 [Roseivirga sp.]|nr:hypothetical protein [Roseivirga sp.]
MKDDEDPGRPLEGQPTPDSENSQKGCGGCFFPLIFIALVLYCSFDKSDFYLMPGEANLWTDAMEEVFDNLEQVTPDSLYLDDELDVFKYSDSYRSILNISYVVHPMVRVRSKHQPENAYIMRVVGIVRHTDADEFTIKEMEMDTLIRIPRKTAYRP